MPGSKLINLVLIIFFLFVFGSIIFGILFPGTIKSLLAMEKFLPIGPNEDVIVGEARRGPLTLLRNNLAADIVNHIDKSQCLLPLRDISVLNNYEDYGIELTNYEGKVKLRVFRSVGEEGGISLDPKTTEQEIQICTINPEAFYNCYLKGEGRDCSTPVYNNIEKILLEKEKIIIAGNSYDYLQGYLMKPEQNKACFMQIDNSFGGCSASSKGLDEDCAQNIQLAIRPCGQISNNLQLCSILYSCAREENVEIFGPFGYCNENRLALRFINQEDCDKTRECVIRYATQNNINQPNECIKTAGVFTLSFSTN